ncbi:MAG: hypothetical protein ACI4T3_01380 [Lactobacillus sp.]
MQLRFFKKDWYNIADNATIANINGIRFLKAPEKLTLNEGVKAYEHPNRSLSPVATATQGDTVQVCGQIGDFYLIMGLVGSGKGFGEKKNFDVNPGAILIAEIENGGQLGS